MVKKNKRSHHHLEFLIERLEITMSQSFWPITFFTKKEPARAIGHANNTGNNKGGGWESIIEGRAIDRDEIGQWRVGGAVSPVSSRGQSEVNSFAVATWPENRLQPVRCVLSTRLSLSLPPSLSDIILYNFVGGYLALRPVRETILRHNGSPYARCHVYRALHGASLDALANWQTVCNFVTAYPLPAARNGIVLCVNMF